MMMNGSEQAAMNDSEREALAEKLDADLEAFIELKVAESAKKRAEERCSVEDKTVDELAAELLAHPAFMKEFDETKPMSPAMEALQAMKYESESNDDNALSFKEDGNKQFERKKYRLAIDNYSAGIKCQPVDRLLNAVLYTNRAAANFNIGNFRSSLTDCTLARKFKADHLKAIVRGCQCCMELKRYAEAITWCNEGLAINATDAKFKDMRIKAEQLLRNEIKTEERNKRKALTEARKKIAADDKLLAAINARGIRVESSNKKHSEVIATGPTTTTCLDPPHPACVRVTLDESDVLHWPVMFMYPEFGETDVVSSLSEESRLEDQIELMFGDPSNRPGWDSTGVYTPNNIQVYFEEREKKKLHKVAQDIPLGEILQNRSYVIAAGTPCFILLSQQSPYMNQFLLKYKHTS